MTSTQLSRVGWGYYPNVMIFPTKIALWLRVGQVCSTDKIPRDFKQHEKFLWFEDSPIFISDTKKTIKNSLKMDSPQMQASNTRLADEGA